MAILIFTPNPLLDFTATVPNAENKINRIDSFNIIAGGKGINVGKVLVNHGHKVIACSFSGGFSGDLFKDLIKKEGQIPLLTQISARNRIGFQAINSTTVMENGFLVTKDEVKTTISNIEKTIKEKNIDLVICSGSIPHKNLENIFVDILSICNKNKINCWIDSYGKAMDKALSCNTPPDLVKPNKEEFKKSTLWNNAKEIHLTNGSQGTKVITQNKTETIVPIKTKEINPIGSGDCYIAALAHSKLNNWTTEKQLQYASAAGSLNASMAEIANVTQEDIEDFIKTNSLF